MCHRSIARTAFDGSWNGRTRARARPQFASALRTHGVDLSAAEIDAVLAPSAHDPRAAAAAPSARVCPRALVDDALREHAGARGEGGGRRGYRERGDATVGRADTSDCVPRARPCGCALGKGGAGVEGRIVGGADAI